MISKNFGEVKYRGQIEKSGPECYSDDMVLDGKILYINTQISSVCPIDIGAGDTARLKEFLFRYDNN